MRSSGGSELALAVVLLALPMALAGCGGTGQAATPTPERHYADASVLDQLGHADCEVSASPAALAGEAAVVLSGVVRGVVPGPATLQPHNAGEKLRTNFMVVEVDVDDVAKGADLLGGDGKHAYIALGRGMNVVPEATGVVDPTTDPNPSIDTINKALPAGTRVIAFTGPFNWTTTGDARFEDTERGRPAGSELLGGFADCGQAINFDPGSGHVGAWQLTFDELADAVDKLP